MAAPITMAWDSFSPGQQSSTSRTVCEKGAWRSFRDWSDVLSSVLCIKHLGEWLGTNEPEQSIIISSASLHFCFYSFKHTKLNTFCIHAHVPYLQWTITLVLLKKKHKSQNAWNLKVCTSQFFILRPPLLQDLCHLWYKTIIHGSTNGLTIRVL